MFIELHHFCARGQSGSRPCDYHSHAAVTALAVLRSRPVAGHLSVPAQHARERLTGC